MPGIPVVPASADSLKLLKPKAAAPKPRSLPIRLQKKKPKKLQRTPKMVKKTPIKGDTAANKVPKVAANVPATAAIDPKVVARPPKMPPNTPTIDPKIPKLNPEPPVDAGVTLLGEVDCVLSDFEVFDTGHCTFVPRSQTHLPSSVSLDHLSLFPFQNFG